jgi:hypothetical protein
LWQNEAKVFIPGSLSQVLSLTGFSAAALYQVSSSRSSLFSVVPDFKNSVSIFNVGRIVLNSLKIRVKVKTKMADFLKYCV